MDTSFISQFKQMANQFPNKVAIHYLSQKITYQELDMFSDLIALKIQQHHVPEDSGILIEADKSIIAVIYLIGILKAGCYYIPITSGTPYQRLVYLIENSQATVGFFKKHYSALQSVSKITCLSMSDDLISFSKCKVDKAVKGLQINKTKVACCLYTSGSTGQPKGVLITHVGIIRFFEDIDPYMNIDATSNCLNTAPLIFDVSIIDTLLPLARGATLFITPEIIIPKTILKIIDHQQITHMSGVASTLNILFQNKNLLDKYSITSLQVIMTGAELLQQKTLLNILLQNPNATLFNGYGLTETTCACTVFKINRDNVHQYLLYPIGKPLHHTKIKVMCSDGSLGDEGELLIAGEQLMLGYLNNPEATAAAFVFIEGERFLKTGDMVSLNPQGDLIFRGRNDTQVKMNGYRIDLNEIKYSLLSLHEIKEAEVFKSDNHIVAGISFCQAGADKQNIKNIQQALRDKLPYYMQPKKWIILDALPKLATGKTDLRKLYACI